MSSFQIAIDGPVAAGKGTVAKLVAKRLNFLYIDTGATYRTAALLTSQAGVPLSDEDAIVALVEPAEISMHNPTPTEADGRQTTVIANGQDVSWAIRTESMSLGASAVAKLPKLRHILVKKQQAIAAAQNVVMEGRDITYRVLPKAQLKIYLTADAKIRANRRHQELLARGQDVTFETVHQDLITRDKQDMERAADPLKIVPGAWVLDTTNLTIEEVVDQITTKARSLMQP
jgi:cytidylate kinase